VDELHPDGRPAPIHLTGPSVLPLAAAVGLTVGLVGLILSWWFVGLGGLILLITAVLWVQTVRGEVDSLPAERR
jgi:hypothetical protein